MNLSDYYFDLPEEHIAKYPPKNRDGGRLMVVPTCWDKDIRKNYSSLIVDLPQILRKGDLLVINNTKVIPARIFGKRKTGGKVEIFVLSYDIHENTAIVMPNPVENSKNLRRYF